jgi:hypothetical protein
MKRERATMKMRTIIGQGRNPSRRVITILRGAKSDPMPDSKAMTRGEDNPETKI